MKWKRYTVQPYEVDVYFCVSRDSRAIERKLANEGFFLSDRCSNEVYDGDEGAFTTELFKDKHVAAMLICLKKVPRSPRDYGAMAHEIIHAKNLIFKYIGSEDTFSIDHDEPEAYMVQRITQAFIEFVRRK